MATSSNKRYRFHAFTLPAGVLLLLGGLASLSALALVKPIKSSFEVLPETKPIAGFASQKKAISTFNSREELHPVNLTTEGKIDWICWRSDDPHGEVRRRSGGKLFTPLKLLSGATPELAKSESGPSRAFIWSDGDSLLPDKVAYPGFHTADGFMFSVKVDTAPHTLTVYVGGYKAGGDFAATVSDGSVPTITKSDIALGEGYYSRAYKIHFRASSPGQSVHIVWKKSRGEGNVSIQGATLS